MPLYGVPFVSKLLKKRVFNCEVKIYKYLLNTARDIINTARDI